MTKKDLIDAIAKQAQLTVKQAEDAFKATFQIIQDVMTQEGKVSIPDFGSFSTKIRAERQGRNPSTGNPITIPKAVVASFKPATQLKDFVNSNSGKA